MSDTKKHNFMNSLFHFLYRTSDTQYQLMLVDIVSLTALILLFLKTTIGTFNVNCFDQTFNCKH